MRSNTVLSEVKPWKSMLYLRSDIQNRLCYGFLEKLCKEHALFFLYAEIRWRKNIYERKEKKTTFQDQTEVVWGRPSLLFTPPTPLPLSLITIYG